MASVYAIVSPPCNLCFVTIRRSGHLTQRNAPGAHWTLGLLAGLGASLSLAAPALAMDCKKAVSPADKAICADPAALAADQALESAYAALSSAWGEAEKKQLLQSQRSWLKDRAATCVENKKASAP